ncbi:putative E3 ubiquitin-protein ligase HUL4 ASCRUDRAFT_22218, partial [Ascoidea rubescens DSM 1968]
LNDSFRDLCFYLYKCFNSLHCLNTSFTTNNAPVSHSHSNVNYHQIAHFFNLILSLPTKKPFFIVLSALNNLLKSFPTALTTITSNPTNLRFFLIILQLPSLHSSLLTNTSSPSNNLLVLFNRTEIKSLSFQILSRSLGLLSNLNQFSINYLANWFSRLSLNHFTQKIDLLNLYINLILRLHINSIPTQSHHQFTNNSSLSLYSLHSSQDSLSSNDKFLYTNSLSIDTPSHQNNTTTNLSNLSPQTPSSSASAASQNSFIPLPLSTLSRLSTWGSPFSSQRKNNLPFSITKTIPISKYSHDWRLKAASKVLSYFYTANINNSISNGLQKCPSSFFYNTFVDFIHFKQDFDTWQNSSSNNNNNNNSNDNYINQIILSINNPSPNKNSFTFCQYPFLLSLAAKIKILEYEAKRQMQNEAEQAFIKSIDKKTFIDVVFKIRVRRNFITTDSLFSIKKHKNDLKKSLRVEFIGESGLDAGGLKKDWFLLLTKNLFNPENAMFFFSDESNLTWFTLKPIDNNYELYHLVGVVLGLAIYNSTILDLNFPSALYKKLLNKPVNINDYAILYPQTAHGLNALLNYNNDDFEDIFSLSFVVTYKDLFGNILTADLIPNGSNINVTNKNKHLYVHKYVDFFLNKAIHLQFNAFKSGFDNVINGNAISLFSWDEIQLLLCGSDEQHGKLDVVSLRRISKYNGWDSVQQAQNSNVVNWFWHYFENLSYLHQKKLLLFVTGSDRLPAIGITSLNFKITKLGDDSNNLPIAHTCFNEICLYEYSSEEKFLQKLEFAIFESEGFELK